MSRIKIRHGAVVKCDMVTVSETDTDIIFDDECQERFTTYSMGSLARKQAADVGFVRLSVARVTWPGARPKSKGKVDLCAKHATCIAPIRTKKTKEI